MTETLNVLVIAHPDDESMFFIPTIRYLQNNGECLWLMCLTNGDYDGLGAVRAKELFKTANSILQVQRVVLLDDKKEGLADHPSNAWDTQKVAGYIRQELEKALSQTETPLFQKVRFITFDHGGVSGHINHRDTFWAVKSLCLQLKNNSKTSLSTTNKILTNELWTLQTETNLFLKYVPVYCWLLFVVALLLRTSSVAFSSPPNALVNDSSTTTLTLRLHSPTLNWRAMASHKSQFVWYRRLFVVFSSYTYMNRLQRISLEQENKKDS